jgi:predicted P-loop ATPase/GTPase
MTNGLLSVNVQNVNVQNVANVTDSLNNAQVSALIQALNNNPQARAAADALTQRLRREGKIDTTLRVVGFQNGQVIVASASAAAGSPTTGNPDPNAAGSASAGTAGTATAQAFAQLATALSNSLVNLNVQGASFQTVVDANTILSRDQVNGLVQSVQANHQARQNSEALTRRFRAEGRIGPQQRVIAFQDGRVFVIGGGS